MNPEIAIGQPFPDFVLPDHTRTPRRLSSLQTRDDPMLVVLIRGFFCPKDREQLKELTRFHPQLVVGSCQLVVIYYWGRPSTAELHAELRELTRAIRPDWDLSTPGLRQRWDAGDKAGFYPYGVKSMERTLTEMAGAVDQYAGAAEDGRQAG
jgi:hypothetical protein